ncbi:MAG TPA: 3-deoxy-8-phosphooctulonate synthase, partial [Longimicrobiaceae bacterium]|nr:3-deoxy-8-phosphooctulonate synthase [Longimicrobiaceae bacterium]
VERAIEHRTMPGEPVPGGDDPAAAPAPAAGGRAEPAALFRVGGPFFLIAGPCVLEDDALNARIAEALARVADDLRLPVVFKASFDKANRSAPGSPRGPGLDEGLRRLEAVRSAAGLPLLTDVHEAAQCAPAAQVVDALQIPAFLCRQTDLLAAAGATGKPVNVKKGQWMAPREMRGAAEKVRGAGSPAVAVTERGTFFGYGNLVVDMRAFAELREACGAPAVFDGTHSVQRPGEGAGVSGGDPRHIPALVRAAAAAGADGLFLEVHPDPAAAPSDRTSMLPLERLRELLDQVLAIRAAVGAARG